MVTGSGTVGSDWHLIGYSIELKADYSGTDVNFFIDTIPAGVGDFPGAFFIDLAAHKALIGLA
jgi:hypothetical protein